MRREGSASERGDIMETSKSCLCSQAATARQRAKTMNGIVNKLDLKRRTAKSLLQGDRRVHDKYRGTERQIKRGKEGGRDR